MATQDSKQTPKQEQDFPASGRQKARVFFEGREVPFINAQTIFRPNQPAAANIELVPLNVIKFVKPRTQVHIFVRDTNMFGDDDYYLCFEGEVMGRGMVKRQDGRAMRVTAFDYTNYWDDAKAYMMNPNFLMGKITPSVMFGEPTPNSTAKAQAGQVIATAGNTNSFMIDILTAYKEGKTGAIDLVQGIAEVCRRLASVNEFYRSAYERLRIIDRMNVYPSGRLGKFLKQLKVEEFLASFTGMHGGMYSLRQMLMSILTIIFHDSVTVPFPSFIKGKKKDKEGLFISQYLFIPDCYPLPPPKCNVIFPNQQISFSFDEDFKSAPTRYGLRASFPLVSGNDSTQLAYPIQYFPTSFSDYMFRKRTASVNEKISIFGPSSLIKSGAGTYADVFYKDPSAKKVGTAYAPVLRESDYLSNEESIKGIYYEDDLLVPAYSALVRQGNLTVDSSNKITDDGTGVGSKSRNAFMREVGNYLFYKKRYSARNVSAEVMFNPYLVPGFNALFLDDSAAGQSFIAKIQSISHNLTNTGFTSVLELGLGRDFDEIDFMSGGAGDPPLPQWFDQSVFGIADNKGDRDATASKKLFDQETAYLSSPAKKVIGKDDVEFRNKFVKNPTVFPTLSKFYKGLLGCDSITRLGSNPTMKGELREVVVTTKGATEELVDIFKRIENQQARDQYIRSYVKRPVTRMVEAFAFLGAEPAQGASKQASAAQKTVPDEFAKFVAITDKKRWPLPGRFDGINYSDEKVLKVRRDVIDAYIQVLQTRRGFRG